MFSRTRIIISVVFLSVLGLADSSYLTIKHYIGGEVICGLATGCEQVLTSPYAEFFGAPVALFGVLGYFLIGLAAALFLLKHRQFYFFAALYLAFFGFLVSMNFLYLQIAVIGSYCLWCLISTGLMSAIFAILISCQFFYAKENR